ncbi:MAG: hypothetical protein JO248_05550 [Acidimicrobiia bacterium]|nr:hypothetical protein [Acidimicrobiia bacterium]
MEILDYFKAIGRRFWVLVLVPLVAGVGDVIMITPQSVRTATAIARCPGVRYCCFFRL